MERVACEDFHVSLDGGGSKGAGTLGVLREIEAIAGRPLCEEVDPIYGTIAAALLALGHAVEDIGKQFSADCPPTTTA